MAGNARFHNKWHRRDHHSIPTPGYPDSASDPIGSPQEPFYGDFVTYNSISAHEDLYVDGDATILGSLSVYGDLSYFDTYVSVTSSLSVVNHGIGPAVKIEQYNMQPVFQVEAKSVPAISGNQYALYIDNLGLTQMGGTSAAEKYDKVLATKSKMDLSVYGNIYSDRNVIYEDPDPFTVYVSTSGSDTNSGLNRSQPVRTIKKAAQIVFNRYGANKATIIVQTGEYNEINPIYIPDGTTVLGEGYLRRTNLYAYHRQLDYFWLNRACYVWGFTFRNTLEPAACTAFPNLLSGTAAYHSAFNTPGYEIDTKKPGGPFGLPLVSKPYITTSPYIQGCSSITNFLISPIQPTLVETQVIDLAYTNGISAYPTIVSSITGLIAVIARGPAGAPPIVQTAPLPGASSAAALLAANRTFIQKEVIEYIDQEYPGFAYNKDSCQRDAGYIVDGLVYDVTNGTNLSSINNGFYYWNGNVSRIAGQERQTIAAWNYISFLAKRIINNQTAIAAQTFNYALTGGPAAYKVNNSFDIINFGILNNSFPALSSGAVIPGGAYAADLLTANKTFIQKEVVSYVDKVYPGFLTTAQRDKCERDTGYVVDAVAFDTRNNTNASARRVGSFYWLGATSLVPGQQIETVNALNYAKYLSKYIINNKPVENVGAACGIRVDGSLALGFLRSFVTDSFTQFNQDGKGVHVINCGYAQLVSTFTICTRQAVMAESGGQCSISTSNASFGLSGLVADGKSEFPVLTGYMYDTTPLAENYMYVYDCTPNPLSAFVSALQAGRERESIPIEAPYNGLLVYADNDPASRTDPVLNPTGVVKFHGIKDVQILPPISAFGHPYAYRLTLEKNTTAPLTASNSNPRYIRMFLRSQIASSSHAFEYIGTGVELAKAVPALGGRANNDIEAVWSNGGIVYFSSTNERGDFKVGNGFTIVQEKGRVEGLSFDKSILSLVTPLILSLA
jgi:hypothetical protein